MPERCPRCGHEVHPLGSGTERVEETLAELFPDHAVERFDRDCSALPVNWTDAIDRVHSGQARILVGTQMLTKGHRLSDVAMVAVLNADQGLFGTDFRAAERLAQTIVQVAGRAGRADRPGEVLIQSQFPDHPLLQSLLEQGYEGFAPTALANAQARTGLRSRAGATACGGHGCRRPLHFLATRRAPCIAAPPGVVLQPPVPAAMARRAGRHHAQLLVEAANARCCRACWPPGYRRSRRCPKRAALRWALDVDPLDVF